MSDPKDVMSDHKNVMGDHKDMMSLQAQAELVKDIKKNVASLKTSIDQILLDMDNIKVTKLEILEKFGCVKNESINDQQLQETLGKAKRVMKKSEENQKKLEIVLKKINNFNIIHTLAPLPPYPHEKKRGPTNANRKEEKIKLQLLNHNKYALTDVNTARDNVEEVGCDKVKKESAFKELQWILKLKLYKLRHHYDKLGYDLDLEERTPLPLSRRRS